MQIANPIYDVVFKYLLEDSESAILLLSAIIDQPIETLEFLPQEGSSYLKNHSLTVYRVDFSAKIKTGENEFKQVIIEIQKAKLPSDIMRFRRYLGEQYANKDNRYTALKQQKNGKIKKINTPLPIITLYFLAYPLEHHRVPVIRVDRRYHDVVKNKILSDHKETFIESLTHDSYVIQISELDKEQKSELERLLSIFDQKRHIDKDSHILELKEENYPAKYCRLIRRLQRAIAEPEVRTTMDVEDDYLEHLENQERLIEKQEQALEEKDQKLEENKQKLEKKDQTIEEKDQKLEEKDQMIEKLLKQLKKQK